jgi:hypothetical protein
MRDNGMIGFMLRRVLGRLMREVAVRYGKGDKSLSGNTASDRAAQQSARQAAKRARQTLRIARRFMR